MGHSTIQTTMRCVQVAAQHKREAVDRLVGAVKRNRGPKKDTEAAKGGNELVTGSVTGK